MPAAFFQNARQFSVGSVNMNLNNLEYNGQNSRALESKFDARMFDTPFVLCFPTDRR